MTERSLSDLFHRVNQALPEEQQVLTIPPEMLVKEVLQLMQEHNYSHIPVVAGEEVLGVFSFRSLATGLVDLPDKERAPLELPVEEFLEKLAFSQISDELTELLGEFENRDALLVGTESGLEGIITTVDALRYFYHVASPYVLLREIELAVRELIHASLDETQLQEVAQRSLTGYYESIGAPCPLCLEQMSFNDYIVMLRFQGTWEKFQEAFGGTANTVYAKLEPLPELRNDMFHFRRELTAEEYDMLRDCRDWLLTRVRKVEARRSAAGDNRVRGH